MSCDANKSLVQRFFAVVNNKEHVGAFSEVVAPSCVINGRQTDIHGVQDCAAMMRAAFPDERIVIEELIGEGDKVVARLRSEGTHEGHWQSPIGDIAPTGKTFVQTGVQIFRIENAMIVEMQTEWDVLGHLQQLGALPGSAETAG